MIQDRYKGTEENNNDKTLDNSVLSNTEVKSPHSPNPRLHSVSEDSLLLIQQLIQSLGISPDTLAKKKPFIAPVLYHHSKNLAKRWRIDFWLWSDDKQKKVRVRKWIPKGTPVDTVDTRMAEAEKLMYFLNTALEQGLLTPDVAKKELAVKGNSLSMLFNKVFEVKTSQNRTTSIGAYKSVANNFEKYWQSRGGLPDVNALQKVTILEYLNHRQVNDGIENGTRNKELSFLKTIFNVGIELELMRVNPCVGIKMLKTMRKKDRVYTKDEVNVLREAYAEFAPDLLLQSYFLYYCYVRPKREARFMKVSHISIKDALLFIPAENAKNGNARYAKMPKKLIELIEEMGVMDSPVEYFVFGNQGKPGAREYGKNTMYNRHVRVAEQVGITGDFYSWKHTGVFFAYLQGIRMKDISLQCGHSDLNETDQYFQKNGFYDRERKFEFE